MEKRLLDNTNKETGSSHIAVLFVESSFPNSGQKQKHGLEIEDLYVDFGDDPKDKVYEEVKIKLN